MKKACWWCPSRALKGAIFSFVVSLVSLSVATGLFGCKARELVRTTPHMDIGPEYWVRVLLANDVNRCSLGVESIFHITDGAGRTMIPDTLFFRDGEVLDVRLTQGGFQISGRSFESERLIVVASKPHIVGVDGDKYRGKIELRLNPDRQSFDVINHVPAEAYLAGVVGAEMPRHWEPEALKAQAIAARTYCLFIKKRFGRRRNWDVTKTAANQVYLGLKGESRQVWKAVNDTAGQVLFCKQDGAEDIFPSYYSSTCAGHTENSRGVFGDSYGPLCGVTCPYCRDVAKAKHFFWPMAQYSKEEVSKKLTESYSSIRQLGTITGIEVARQSEYEELSRVTKVKVVGADGKSDWLRGEDFRLTVDPTGNTLRSTSFKIVLLGDNWAFMSGRGWGHGVGMCQCGAEGMARAGHTATGILGYYYPGARIARVY